MQVQQQQQQHQPYCSFQEEEEDFCQDNNSNSQFPFVHESIAQVLACRDTLSCPHLELEREQERELIDPTTLEVDWNSIQLIQRIEKETTAAVSLEMLQELARSSDRALFTVDNHPQKHIRQTLELRVQLDQPSHSLLQIMAKETTTAENNTNTTNAKLLAATLLALNRLESAIRLATGHATGRAPLLKSMLRQLSTTTTTTTNNNNIELLAHILSCLLLPTPGLNLRNLLWHGFVADIPRPWFALVLVLTHHVQQQTYNIHSKSSNNNKQGSRNDTSHDNNDLLVLDLRAHAPLQTILLEYNNNRANGDPLPSPLPSTKLCAIKQWLLAPSHHPHAELLDLALLWQTTMPACSAALLAILLEHGLRQTWCRVNRRPRDSMARPGAYYVTLDGHGQRHQHDLLLHPYLMSNCNISNSSIRNDTCIPNQLLQELGGPTTALLTDLFASSCGGPNVRAALAHGVWDSLLERDLMRHNPTQDSCATSTTRDDYQAYVMDIVSVLWAAMEAAAGHVRASVQNYRPVFSYAATTRRNLERVMTQLLGDYNNIDKQLCCHNETAGRDKNDADLVVVASLTLPTNLVEDSARRVLQLLSSDINEEEEEQWAVHHVYNEYECNVRLASCAAARTLLQDVANAWALFTEAMEQASLELKRNDASLLSSRQRRQHVRICSLAEFASTLYAFTVYVSLLALEDALDIDDAEKQGRGSTVPPSMLLKAVERSRMCVSTVSTFLTINTERAFKAALEYTKGKAVKVVLQHAQSKMDGSNLPLS